MKKTKQKKEKDPLSSVRRKAQGDLKADCKRSGNSLKRTVAAKNITLCFTAFRKAFLMGYVSLARHGAAYASHKRGMAYAICAARGFFFFPYFINISRA